LPQIVERFALNKPKSSVHWSSFNGSRKQTQRIGNSRSRCSWVLF